MMKENSDMYGYHDSSSDSNDNSDSSSDNNRIRDGDGDDNSFDKTKNEDMIEIYEGIKWRINETDNCLDYSEEVEARNFQTRQAAVKEMYRRKAFLTEESILEEIAFFYPPDMCEIIFKHMNAR